MPPLRHPIQVAARLSGLTPHVIRIWEKRYAAVVPERTATGRRLYSEEDVERLRLLALATRAGHKIGLLAKLSLDDLRQVSGRVGGEPGDPASLTEPIDAVDEAGNLQGVFRGSPSAVQVASRLVKRGLDAIAAFDTPGLRDTLDEAVLKLGQNGALRRVIVPLARQIGEAWERGDLTAAHEHFASAALRDFMAVLTRPYTRDESAPGLVAATPTGQLHELGALIATATASQQGWRTTYLGPGLPPAEIAGAATQVGARAVLLSLVYPPDNPQTRADLVELRRLIPDGVSMIVGGRSARAYRDTLEQIRALTPETLSELQRLLDSLRQP